MSAQGSGGMSMWKTVTVRNPQILVLFLVMGLGVVGLAAQEESAVAREFTDEEALALGQRMYREGILPSGEPMKAIVQGDIHVDGTMFSCRSCHLRSGLGSTEGTVITLPINGDWLSQPLVGARMSAVSREKIPKAFSRDEYRPPYTDTALARAIRLGRDPGNRKLDGAMPRYSIGSADMELMVAYLRNLSAEWSPGVTDTTLSFATVISADVNPLDREAMLATLEAYVRDRNSQVRHEEERAKRGPYYKEEKYKPYRRLSLAVWELQGPRQTWPAQLEEHLSKKPVFALLGGIVTGEWAPIHDFCERNQVPCLFPITDFPVISDSDWYTLYFSKGFYQEGEAAAKFLRRSENLTPETPVIQVFREGARERALARGFQDFRRNHDLPEARIHVLGPDEVVTQKLWTSLVAVEPAPVFVLWMDLADLEAVSEVAMISKWPQMMIVSAGQLGDDFLSLPDRLRPNTFITHRTSLRDDKAAITAATKGWLKVKGLSITNYSIQSRMYALGWMLTGPIKMMRDDFYSDYFLDLVDMMRDQDYAIGLYPRLSFGPGQRYASKGCFIIQLTEGEEPTMVTRSDWVIH